MSHPRSARIGVLLASAGLALAGCRAAGGGLDITPEPGAQQAARMQRAVTRTVTMPYLVYFPADYDPAGGRRWPLMLFLHGAGERGEDLEKVKYNGPPKLIAEGRDYPCIVVSPLCPARQWWDTDALFALLDELEERLPVDSERIYVTGLSMGGFATWNMAIARPERFAAAVPICGGGNVHEAKLLKDLPLWAFHGAKDEVVPPERTTEMIAEIRRAGGDPRMTIYPDEGHGSWVPAYQDDALYEWLFAQRRR